MAMDPIWESDFRWMSYGFRPGRSLHHAVRAVKLALTDTVQGTAGRWVIEGDLASYFDTVHHRLRMKAVKRRMADRRFLRVIRIRYPHID
ncbi:reverse transcriptase family protein [Sulfobacillus acidophilus TPY]|nr:reverse transcriptase family protein [Sulfobacillus acidophilus TPY]